jgi:hypothetical protein
MTWTLNRRYVRELTCNERTCISLSRVVMKGIFPTRTPINGIPNHHHSS